jgi:DeoR/GlpR family transcriptional regulator of sugar metabolism
LTNCYAVAHGMGEQAAIDDVILCPGQFDPRENAVYGHDTVDFLRRFHANRAFIGASGLSSHGFSDVNRKAVAVKRAMMERSDETWLLVDHTKFEQRYLESIGPFSTLCGVITDQAPPENLREKLARAGVEVIVADPEAGLSDIRIVV